MPLHDEERRAAVRARAAGLSRVQPPAIGDDPERIYRTVSSRTSRRSIRARFAQLSRAEQREPAARLGNDSRIMGAAQVSWLTSAARGQRATWKVIANDMPIGLVVRDGPEHFEAVANADDGPPLGRELEIAEISASSAPARSATSSGSPATFTTAPHTAMTRARAFQRLRSVLGVRRRAASCRHVRARHARCHIWAASHVQGGPWRSQTEPSSKRRPAVFWRDANRRTHARNDRQPARPLWPTRFIASSSRRRREHSPHSPHCLLDWHRRFRVMDGALCPAQQ